MKVKVINTSGAETGKEVTLPQDIFGVEPNDHAIYLDVKQYLANQRQGTHSSTEKGDVKGSTRKIKKQKGTVQLEQVVSNLVYSLVVVVCTVQDQEITALN